MWVNTLENERSKFPGYLNCQALLRQWVEWCSWFVWLGTVSHSSIIVFCQTFWFTISASYISSGNLTWPIYHIYIDLYILYYLDNLCLSGSRGQFTIDFLSSKVDQPWPWAMASIASVPAESLQDHEGGWSHPAPPATNCRNPGWINQAGSLRHVGTYSEICHLVMTNSSPWYRWPIEIDALPFLKMAGFSMAMLNNQMVFLNISHSTKMRILRPILMDLRKISALTLGKCHGFTAQFRTWWPDDGYMRPKWINAKVRVGPFPVTTSLGHHVFKIHLIMVGQCEISVQGLW